METVNQVKPKRFSDRMFRALAVMYCGIFGAIAGFTVYAVTESPFSPWEYASLWLSGIYFGAILGILMLISLLSIYIGAVVDVILEFRASRAK